MMLRIASTRPATRLQDCSMQFSNSYHLNAKAFGWSVVRPEGTIATS
jgi:hypothetical protein